LWHVVIEHHKIEGFSFGDGAPQRHHGGGRIVGARVPHPPARAKVIEEF